EPDIASSFDAGGNQQELQRGQAMLWDSRNQLSRVTLVKRETEPDDYECYRYDRPGHRLRKTGFTHSSGRTLRSEVRYLPGLEIHRQADGEEHHVISVEAGRSSVRALHWPEGAHNDQQRYSLSDHLGSSTLELDDEAGVLTQEHYYPFGGTACWAGKSALVAQYKTIRYSGKERDATGLYYYGYRYYAPWLQRWISSDPGGDIDGPNHYRFVSNNPLTRLDSYGACSTIPTDVVNAYDRMFKQGLVWSGLMHGSESGVETIMRVSKNNVAILDGEIESEQQRRLAERIASIPTSEYSITHFGSADFTTLDGVHFKSLVTLQNEKRDISYEGNSMGGNIPNFGNHDFAFFALEAGEKAGKTKSRFGAFRYHATLEKLGVKAGYTHIEVGDLLRPNTRDISEARARSLPWMEDLVTDEDGILNFKNRVGLRPDKEADLLFYGKDILKGLGLKIAVDLNSLNAATQETVVEWTANDRPLENLSEVINVFYRPQIAVPGGLKLQCGEFTLRPPPK
ncbi:RHS repeat domain-containing protein, partial [Pseudomonas fluorescens]